jgi:hypothetical protein
MLTIIESLNRFSFNNVNLNIIKRSETNNELNQNKYNEKKSKMKSLIYYNIIDKDVYFWILYILLNSYDVYINLNKNNKFKINTNKKYEFIELIKSNKNVKKSIKNKIIINLGNIENLEIESFKILTNILKINICFVNNIFCQIIQNDKTDKNYNLVDIKGYLYKQKKTINDLEKYIFVNDINKPVKNIGYYKLLDLQTICKKLNISITSENGKNKTKKILYETLCQYL